MKKRILALVLIAVMAVSLFAACGKSNAITQEKAQQVALEHAGLSADQVEDVHVHVTDHNGIPCYSVHITTAENDFSIVINAANGEVIG